MAESFRSAAAPKTSVVTSSGGLVIPEVVIYEHRHWQGANYRTNLDVPWVGNWWNDRISGIIVVRGTWRFFEHIDYNKTQDGKYWDLGPGYYEYISDFGIPNDVISSFCCIGV